MAYVLGFWYADGSIYPSARGSYIAVTSVDEFIIQRIKRWRQSEHTIRIEPSVFPNGKLKFILRIGNKALYKNLLNLGLFPSKSLTIRMPAIPREFLKDFIRGYFDGDGCAYLGKRKGKRQEYVLNKLVTVFTSGSRLFLEDLLDVSKSEMDLKLDKVYQGNRCFQLRFGTSDSVKFFKFMYRDIHPNFFFMCKFEVYEKYFGLRPQRIDKEVEVILRCVQVGRVAKKQTRRSAKPLYMGANPITASE